MNPNMQLCLSFPHFVQEGIYPPPTPPLGCQGGSLLPFSVFEPDKTLHAYIYVQVQHACILHNNTLNHYHIAYYIGSKSYQSYQTTPMELTLYGSWHGDLPSGIYSFFVSVSIERLIISLWVGRSKVFQNTSCLCSIFTTCAWRGHCSQNIFWSLKISQFYVRMQIAYIKIIKNQHQTKISCYMVPPHSQAICCFYILWAV